MGFSGTQHLNGVGDTAFEQEGTFPQVFLATESLQNSKTCNTALNCRGQSLGDTAFAALGGSGTQHLNERALFRMYPWPQSRCKTQRHAIPR